MHPRPLRSGSLAAILGLFALGLIAPSPLAGADPAGPPIGLVATQILSGMSLHHTFVPVPTNPSPQVVPAIVTPLTAPLTNPDDITQFGDAIFVGFQNGVGPQGQPSTDGNADSTIVEFTPWGHVLGQWDITGKADGVTADPAIGGVVATVNEDANSSLYVIHPWSATVADEVVHYQYSESLPHGGGTDAITVVDGQLFISASAPGTTGLPAPQSTYPAVYTVSLDRTTKVATVSPLFFDEDTARVANVGPQLGTSTSLALTDPDSNELVPWDSPRFAGDFMLTSQGDLQQIYVDDAGTDQHLSVLTLSQSADDTAWASSWSGVLYATDSTNDAVDAVHGGFRPGEALVAATPCGSNRAPSTCPAPPAFPANYLGTLNPWTGQVQRVTVSGQPFTPQGGLLFVPHSTDDDDGGPGPGH